MFPAAQPSHASVRPRPPLFRALGDANVPDSIEIAGRRYDLLQVFKHDSWAATALYSAPSGRVVCKFNRQQPIGLIPMRWLGRILAKREAALLRRLNHVASVPRWSGDVYCNGKLLRYAVAHVYVPGHALGKLEHVDARFIARLETAIAEIHRHQVAYVDLHKRENILVGDDGLPYLVDFQIGFALPRHWPGNSLVMRIILRMLQRSDEYHLEKHRRALLPWTASRGARGPRLERPWWIRLHRIFAEPFRTWRRWLLVQIGVRNRDGRAHSEFFAEQAIREERESVNLV